MIRGLYLAATGMTSQMQMMDAISNNMANGDTAGYKKDVVVSAAFHDLLTKKIESKNTDIIGGSRLGVGVSNIMINFEQGSLKQTDHSLDVALTDKGFLVVNLTDKNGNVTPKYTRDGTFTLDREGYLVTKDGYRVVGVGDQEILIGKGQIVIDEEGTIFVDDEKVSQLKTTNFADLQFMKKIGSNLYETYPGAEEAPYKGDIIQGFIEGSNVNVVEEMVAMISMTRNYEANQRMIQVHDSLLGKAVNEVGRL